MLLKILLSLLILAGLTGGGILILWLWINKAGDDWGDWSNGRW